MFKTQGNCVQQTSHINNNTSCGIWVLTGFGMRYAPYPNLLIVFDGASAFPVKTEAHEVNAQNAGQRFDASPLYCGSLENTYAHCKYIKFHISTWTDTCGALSTPFPCTSHSSRHYCPPEPLLWQTGPMRSLNSDTMSPQGLKPWMFLHAHTCWKIVKSYIQFFYGCQN